MNFSVSLKVRRFQRLFWPSKWIIFEELWINRSWKIKLAFTFEDFMSSIKSYGQNSERGGNGHFLWHFHTPSLSFVHNFLLKDWNLKRIFWGKIWLDFPTSFSLKSLKKFHLIDQSHLWSLLILQTNGKKTKEPYKLNSIVMNNWMMCINKSPWTSTMRSKV